MPGMGHTRCRASRATPWPAGRPRPARPGRWAPAAGPTAGHRPHVGQSSDAAPRPRRALSLASFCLASSSRNGDDLSMASLGSGSRVTRAHRGWAVGVFASVCAVSGRASFGVASVGGSGRFGVDGAVRSLCGLPQLGSCAAARPPAGLLLDRLGPRRMLVLGAVTMAIGQVLLAFATDVPTALVARLLTGVGDAATLISVVRLIATWFPTTQVPVFTQLATMIGQFGQAVAAVPFLALLVNAGWTAAWGSLAFLLVFSVLLVIAIVQDEPPGEPGAAPTPVTRPGQVLKDVFTSRAAWSGFFVHWMCLVSVNAFLFMWGVPYMTSLGIGSAEVGTLLTINVVIMVALGPLIGVVTGRFPRRRPLLGWIAGSVLTVTWAVTLLVPGPMTAWQLLPLIT